MVTYLGKQYGIKTVMMLNTEHVSGELACSKCISKTIYIVKAHCSISQSLEMFVLEIAHQYIKLCLSFQDHS